MCKLAPRRLPNHRDPVRLILGRLQRILLDQFPRLSPILPDLPAVSATGDDSGSSSESDDEPQIDPIEIARRYDMLQAMSTAYDEMEDQDDEDSVNGDSDNDNSEASPAAATVPPAPPIQLQDVYTPPPPPPAEMAARIPLSYCAAIDPDENAVDLFHPRSRKPPPNPTPVSQIHESSCVCILYLLVAWLHSQFHVPMRALSAILSVVRLMLLAAGLDAITGIAATYKTVQSHMGIEPSFDILPVCVKCLEPHPADYKAKVCCKCALPLFLPTIDAPQSKKKKKRKKLRPNLQMPYKSISEQLPNLLSLPGIEAELDRWRKARRQPSVLNDISDGNVWKNVLGHDNLPFFRDDPGGGRGHGELRIGVTLGCDWYTLSHTSLAITYLTQSFRFSYLRSNVSGSHTSCPMSFCIANLPPEYRYILRPEFCVISFAKHMF